MGRKIDLGPISPLLERIIEKWNPVGIWLFGSRARGTADPESDWDLLVVAPDDAPDVDDPLAGWKVRKGTGIVADVLPCRASEFQDARSVPNTLAYEAAHFGILIYER